MKKIGKMRTIASKPLVKKNPTAKNRAIAARVSTVEAHDYDPGTGHLTVTFHGGRRYRYEGVDQKTADGLGKSESKGGYLHAHIIGKFDHVKI